MPLLTNFSRSSAVSSALVTQHVRVEEAPPPAAFPACSPVLHLPFCSIAHLFRADVLRLSY